MNSQGSRNGVLLAPRAGSSEILENDGSKVANPDIPGPQMWILGQRECYFESWRGGGGGVVTLGLGLAGRSGSPLEANLGHPGYHQTAQHASDPFAPQVSANFLLWKYETHNGPSHFTTKNTLQMKSPLGGSNTILNDVPESVD